MPEVRACWLTGAPSPHTDLTERYSHLPFIYLFCFITFPIIYLLLYWVHAVNMCVEIRGQSTGAASLLPPHGSQGSDSDRQA